MDMGICHEARSARKEWLYPAKEMVWRQTYPGHGSHIRAARKLPALLLDGTGLGGDAEWVAGELISNALKYTRSGEHGGWFGVETGLSRCCAWVAVRDLGGVFVPVITCPEAAGELPEGGRGLLGITELASRLEVGGSVDTGHTVRAVFDLVSVPDGQEP